MLFSRDWLGQYVDLRGLPDDPAELARRLTAAGLAVEHMHPSADGGDLLLDVEVTTNRPDCMNHFGLAREAAVLFGQPLRPPRFAIEESADPADVVTAAASVAVEDSAGCPRYVARVVRGVRVGESPAWLRKRLEAIGLRSINNVVDVTNFVLWELGQPLHAFDLAKLAGRAIVVRRARPGERLVTLDGVERILAPEMLVIADAERAVALAGVMGGLDSEVTDATVDVLLESAHFGRRAVRRTARGLGLHTDASHRFERGADPAACLSAADRAAALLAELAGGRVLTGALDVHAERPPAPRARLELARLEAFAGATVPAADIERWLGGLGFAPRRVGSGVSGASGTSGAGGDGAPAWHVTVPSWRLYDIEPRPWIPASSSAPPSGDEIYPADLYEEVLRLHGFDAIPASLPALGAPDAGSSAGHARRERLRDHLAACGFAEAIHFAFQDPALDAAFPSLRPAARPLVLANPLSERASVLRRSLVPNLVESARFNQRRGAAAVRLFEVATVFYERPGAAEGELPDQPEHVALVCGGTVGSSWDRQAELDFFDLKGVVESLAEQFGVELTARPAELPGLLPGSTAELFLPGGTGPDGTGPVGYLGRVEAEEGAPLYAAELAVEALAGGTAEGAAALQVENPSRFPGVSADYTLTHSLDVPWAEIRQAIGERRPEDLVSFGLTVRYRGEGVPEGAVNTTIHFLYTARDRSLTQDEVNERQAALTRELERRFGWRR